MHGPVKGLFYAICYPIIAAVGFPANLVSIIILSRGRCGLSKCVTYYLVAIAVSDFFVIITGCILNRISRIYFIYSVLSTTSVCKLSTILARCSREGSVWLTVAFTFDRFVSICCQSLKIGYCTVKIASLLIGMTCILSCVKNFPLYNILKPLYILNGLPWLCDIKSIFFTLPAWQAYDWMEHILTPILPFLLILLLNALTVRHILAASKARKKLRNVESGRDPEVESRRRSIILLFAISVSFLLLWATEVGHFFLVRFKGDTDFNGLDFQNVDYILQETNNMFQLLSSCNNVFIYAVSQSRFRRELQKILMCPFTILTVKL
ncbi:probable G-protein coupled receptor 139 [Hemiscyllium ocellatum]|uniref:probable G-protein coupled receptor 139 n=1 Tax=Hemiscyllium ocellatum TaxID=170820 RepID=UPI00296756B0|nr:probable G-protein coupled receptor 139 [Hemiscyllium ocellatum]